MRRNGPHVDPLSLDPSDPTRVLYERLEMHASDRCSCDHMVRDHHAGQCTKCSCKKCDAAPTSEEISAEFRKKHPRAGLY